MLLLHINTHMYTYVCTLKQQPSTLTTSPHNYVLTLMLDIHLPKWLTIIELNRSPHQRSAFEILPLASTIARNFHLDSSIWLIVWRYWHRSLPETSIWILLSDLPFGGIGIDRCHKLPFGFSYLTYHWHFPFFASAKGYSTLLPLPEYLVQLLTSWTIEDSASSMLEEGQFFVFWCRLAPDKVLFGVSDAQPTGKRFEQLDRPMPPT